MEFFLSSQQGDAADPVVPTFIDKDMPKAVGPGSF
jgi:hypothetical protein